MVEMNKETETQIQELQLLEQTLQSLIMQKQAFQLELSEVDNALEELVKNEKEIYKISGSIMIKSSKETVVKDLKQKKDLLSLRLKSINEQEKNLSEKSESIREKVLSKIQQKE
ncbi:MAG: prefoldin subunit beta [archaeon]|nr:prefoldin subunit beta [archaeon]